MSIDKNTIEQVKQKINNTNAAVTKEGLIEICNVLINIINQLNDTTPNYESVDVTDGYYVDGTKVVSEQQANIVDITITNGSLYTGDSILDVTVTPTQQLINDNFKLVSDRINSINTLLKAHGLEAS